VSDSGSGEMAIGLVKHSSHIERGKVGGREGGRKGGREGTYLISRPLLLARLAQHRGQPHRRPVALASRTASGQRP
jgi:hypothetical protein